MHKYILVTGAPGSRWSGVVKNIYYSKDVDRSDYTNVRLYSENGNTLHTGAYWDPGMEFDIHEWDAPFTGSGVRIIKSHTFAHELYWLKELNHPIVMVHRNNYECMKWWLEAGGFDISYPNYKPYYQNEAIMWQHICHQNRDINNFLWHHKDKITKVYNNKELCNHIGIEETDTVHNYTDNNIEVYVYT